MLPTPAASDDKGSSRPGQRRGQLSEAIEALGRMPQLKHEVERLSRNRGAMAPEFCEWMMGFPTGWTDLSHRQLRLFDTTGSTD